jgi:cell division cycle 20-like protein 1 (cofactor of APC complex)
MVGGPDGQVQIWDLEKSVKIEDFYHSSGRQRVGVMDWKDEFLLTTGSKDCTVISRDLRQPMRQVVHYFKGHSQEVCGLKWSTGN